MTANGRPGIRLEELAQFIQAEVHGSADILLTGAASLEDAKAGDLAFVAGAKAVESALKSQASAFVVGKASPQ